MTASISQGNIAVGLRHVIDRTGTQSIPGMSESLGIANLVESLNREIGFSTRLQKVTSSPRVASSPRVQVGCETETKISLLQSYVSYFASSFATRKALTEIELCPDVVAAYNASKDLLCSNWSEQEVACYLESNANAYRHVLLGCIADEGMELSTDLSHCLIGLLHSKDQRMVNCACLALISGGADSSELLRKSVPKLGLRKAAKFLEDILAF